MQRIKKLNAHTKEHKIHMVYLMGATSTVLAAMMNKNKEDRL